jgi:xyloglucan-specific exo-beta-1,4-glucanase
VLPDTCRGGRIAISATNSNLIVWLPFDNRPYVSTDGGTNWAACGGITATTFFPSVWEPSLCLASNKTTTNRFYVYKPNLGFWSSNTGATAGTSFTQITNNGLPTFASWSANDRYGVRTVPGQDGGVWVSLDGSSAGAGIYKSTNAGASFTKLGNVKSAEYVAFGIKASGSTYPAAAYMFGQLTADSQNWLYRSDDMGGSWTRINDTAHQFGTGVKAVEADRKVYGRVYVGTGGRSVFYSTWQ